MIVFLELNVSLDAMKTRGFMDLLFILLHLWSETLFLEGMMEDLVTDGISTKQTRREALACDVCVSRHVAVADVGKFRNVNYRVAEQIHVCFHSTIKTFA